MEVKIVGVGEFRSFEREEHVGFLRIQSPAGPFDLPVTEDQLVGFMRGIFGPPDEDVEAPPPDNPPPSSTSSSSPYEAPAFGDEDDFDLEEEEPIRLRRAPEFAETGEESL